MATITIEMGKDEFEEYIKDNRLPTFEISFQDEHLTTCEATYQLIKYLRSDNIAFYEGEA